MTKLYRQVLPGALHLHSVHSDGTGTIPEIAKAAQQAGLRWIIITDHNTLAGRPEQGWYGNLLVIVECETTPSRNHFLTFDLDHVVDWTQPPQQFVDEIYNAGGWGEIAHPDERTTNAVKQPYNWTNWRVDGPMVRRIDGKPVGIEIWNWMSDWAERLGPRTKYLNFFVPRWGVRGPTVATLAWWDRLNVAGKRTFGTGNLDSHATHVPALGRVWEVFPYLYLFRTVTNYLWLPEPLSRDFHTARRQVLDGLGAGHLWFANRHYGQAQGLRFAATSGNTSVGIGEAINLNGEAITFAADAGRRADLRLICNGKLIAKGHRTLHYSTTEPGVYRLEARRWWQPWLYTNPIFVEG